MPRRTWNTVARRRLTRIAAAAAVLVLGACASLPPGVATLPADDPAAAQLTLPSGRTLPVDPASLGYSGRATLRWADGRVYEGDWVDGQPQGQGVETQPDGTRYQGDWERGRRHGHGVLDLPGGDHYDGQFVNGLREGRGTLQSAEGTYQGSWRDDLPGGGQGMFQANDGTYYEGEWRDGQRFGFGSYVGPDGSHYEGDWAYDQPEGFGRMVLGDGASYFGEWRSGQRSGYGRSEGASGVVYEGTFVDGERQGYGRELRPDDSTYVGEWHADKRHGNGREERVDGSFHDGAWELNQALGPGLRHRADGIEISGLWNGDVVSTGLLSLPTGPEYAGPLYSAHGEKVSRLLVKWLETEARRGDPYAQCLLGTTYLDHREPAPDPASARRWLAAAAAAGIAEAQYRLALTYEAIDPPRVVALLSEAAEQGHVGANETLGEYYHSGITVPRNLGRAVHYYERALRGGSVVARNNLAWLLATADEPGQRDGSRAVALIRPIALYTGAWQYLDTLAAAWAAAGDFPQAVDTAQQAVETLRRDSGADQVPDAMQQRLADYRNGQAWVERP